MSCPQFINTFVAFQPFDVGEVQLYNELITYFDMSELDRIWEAALGEIELQVSRPNFATWLKSSRLIEKQEGVAFVSLPNNFAKEWVENKYHKLILAALRNLDDTTKKVEYMIESKSHSLLKAKRSKQQPAFSEKDFSEQLAFNELRVDPETNLNPKYTLNSFIVGSSNELVYAAATAVIKEIGRRYNPLFIYGGVGLGKTHLIQGIGNEIKKTYENRIKVRYIPCEKFINEVVTAMKNKRMEDIKDRYRLIDVLIIDDIQFIGGKERTEEEFFHTFNALYENNKQIIISSDRSPKFLPTLHDRLKSRFEGGMVGELSPPDYELRVAVLKTKLQDKNSSLPDDLISLIATKVQRNFRELDGVLNKILFYQSTKNAPISQKHAEDIINEMAQQPTKNINPNQIIKAVADYFQIPVNDLIGRSRKKNMVEPRQMAMFLLRDMLNMSYPAIGDKLGKRDHTTAIYSYTKLSQEISKNQNTNQKIITIRDLIDKAS